MLCLRPFDFGEANKTLTIGIDQYSLIKHSPKLVTALLGVILYFAKIKYTLNP